MTMWLIAGNVMAFIYQSETQREECCYFLTLIRVNDYIIKNSVTPQKPQGLFTTSIYYITLSSCSHHKDMSHANDV